MDKFFDRFKPSKTNKKGGGGGLRFPGKKNSFGGEGKSLGGNLPGQVIPIELQEPGPLGVKVEKRQNSQGSAIVAMVVEGSQAARAGMERGDILCFAGSDGREEIMYDMFLELAKSNQRPLCFEVRRVKTKSTAGAATSTNNKSAEAFNRKQAVIAAAEAREKKHKQKSKPIPKKTNDLPQMLSTAERNKLEEERLARLQQMQAEEPKSEASRKAIETAKLSEAKTAASLGYNPYETKKATAGQARNATVAMTHGTMAQNNATTAEGGGGDIAALPPVRAPPPAAAAASDDAPVAVPVPVEFQHAYEQAVTSNDHAAVVSSFGILRKLLVNATTKGQQQAPNGTDADPGAKFRRVRLGNAKIKAAVVDTEGSLDIMLCAGFQLAEEGGESVLVFPPGNKGPAWLSTALKQMERYENS